MTDQFRIGSALHNLAHHYEASGLHADRLADIIRAAHIVMESWRGPWPTIEQRQSIIENAVGLTEFGGPEVAAILRKVIDDEASRQSLSDRFEPHRVRLRAIIKACGPSKMWD